MLSTIRLLLDCLALPLVELFERVEFWCETRAWDAEMRKEAP